jgi:imidazolonepropionase-like amidohydrolase
MISLLPLVGALSSGGALAATFAITNATVVTVDGPVLPEATVVVEDGRIAAVGPGLAVPAGAEVVDAGGGWLTPGLIDLHSHMGVYPWPALKAHGDGNEMTHPVTPQVWAGDSVRVMDPAFSRARAGGVTTIHVIPGSANLMGGRGVVLKLRPARTLEGLLVDDVPPTIKMACGENPKRVYEEDHDGPSTRMGNLSWMRATFQAALDYRQARASGAQPPVAEDAVLETVLGVIDGSVKVHVHCYRHDDMEGILRTFDQFGVKVTAFHHATDAYKVRDLLAEHGAGVATWPDWWGFKIEAYDAIPENIKLVKEAGVPVALHSDSANMVQRLPLEAAKVVSTGLDEASAWETITLDPARLLGLDDRIGSITVGKDADLALFDRDPFDVRARVQKTWIEGELVFDRDQEGTPDAHP